MGEFWFSLKYSELNPLYHWVICALCVVLAVQYMNSNNCRNLLKQQSPIPAIIFSIIMILIIGLRVASGGGYGDTSIYAAAYRLLPASFSLPQSLAGDWFFEIIQRLCRSANLKVEYLFLIIATGYIGFMLLAFWRALEENAWFAMMFAFSAYSFLGYGINGLRNGLACSMVTLAIVLIAQKQNWVFGLLLCFFALGVHKSVLLPIAAFAASYYVVKNIYWAIYFWLISILISLVAGQTIMNLFLGLGFDDRLDSYLTSTEYMYMFRHQGFRWDFLLYSSMPIILTWYIIIKKKIQDRVFQLIACTYILSNSFWVMICRTSNSNRFAYLSWFLYPLVIAYAVIRLPIWEDQDRRAGYVLLGHVSFFMIMFFLGM